ncbi:MAG: hypothetical protein Q8P67_24260 [archaeon]|nr:hypothetical protein [archaeon]
MINNTQAELMTLMDKAKLRRNLLSRSLEFQDNHLGALNAASGHLHHAWLMLYRDFHLLRDYLRRTESDHGQILANLSVESQLKSLAQLDQNLPASVASLFSVRKSTFLGDHMRMSPMLEVQEDYLLLLIVPDPDKFVSLPDVKRTILEDRRLSYSWSHRPRLLSDYQQAFLLVREINSRLDLVQGHQASVQKAIAERTQYLSSQEMLALRNETAALLNTWQKECGSESSLLRFEQSQRDIARFFSSEMEFVAAAHRSIHGLHRSCHDLSHAAARVHKFLATGVTVLVSPTTLAAAYHHGSIEQARRQRWRGDFEAHAQQLSLALGTLHAQEMKTRAHFRQVWGDDLQRYFSKQLFGDVFNAFPRPVALQRLLALVTRSEHAPGKAALPVASPGDPQSLFPSFAKLSALFPLSLLHSKAREQLRAFDLAAAVRKVRAQVAAASLNHAFALHRLDAQAAVQLQAVAEVREQIAALQETEADQKEELSQLTQRSATLEARSLGFYNKLLDASAESRKLGGSASASASAAVGAAERARLQAVKEHLAKRRDELASQLLEVKRSVNQLEGLAGRLYQRTERTRQDISAASQDPGPDRQMLLQKLTAVLLSTNPSLQVPSCPTPEALQELLLSQLAHEIRSPKPQAVPPSLLPDLMVFQLSADSGIYKGSALCRNTKPGERYYLSADTIQQLNLMRASGARLAIGSPVYFTDRFSGPGMFIPEGTPYQEVELMVDPELY